MKSIHWSKNRLTNDIYPMTQMVGGIVEDDAIIDIKAGIRLGVRIGTISVVSTAAGARNNFPRIVRLCYGPSCLSEIFYK